MLTVAILAAGKGTRMASSLPKVLHKLSGKTLLQRVINSCNELKPYKIFIIVGHKSKEVEDSVLKNKNIHFIVQNPQKGTGHAIQVLSQQVKKHEGKLMVLNGDVPLIKSETLKDLIKYHDSKKADVSLITSRKKDPHGYGRVFTENNLIEKIVEEKDCTKHERSNVLTNAGIYCFSWKSLSKIINTLKSNNKQKEIYLTDTIALLKNSYSFEVEDNGELQGINNRVQLSECEETLQTLIKKKHMLGGVTIINPASCTISEESIIGLDVIIEANTHIRGNSKISNNCKIGPNSFIKDTIINDNCEIINSTIFNSKIMDHVKIGPYSHIRPNCEISSHSKIGNFVEIKNSKLDELSLIHI